MTENKIKPTIEQVIYCLKAESERYSEVCEECSLYGEVGCDHCFDDTTDVAITLLEKYLQYRTIGTVEEIKSFFNENRKAGYKHGYSDGYNKAVEEFLEKATKIVYEANDRKRNPQPRDIVADIHYKLLEIAEQMKGGA